MPFVDDDFGPDFDARFDILIAGTAHADKLAAILGGFLCRWRVVSHCGAACSQLEKTPLGAVICAREFPDGSWRDLLARTAFLPVPPNVIVISPGKAESLLAEVRKNGGYGVLQTPLTPKEVVRISVMAWLEWDGRRARSGFSAVTRLC